MNLHASNRRHTHLGPQTPRSLAKALGVLALCASICACGMSSREHLASAREALAAADYDTAVESARAGLAAAPDTVAAWGLEIVVLEAHARAGQGPQAKAQLERLAADHPDRIPATEYSAAASQLKAAGEGTAAIEVLDLGMKRFPEDRLLAAMIEASASGGSDPAELEMLRSLGYIE
jgi:hypothetical protein